MIRSQNSLNSKQILHCFPNSHVLMKSGTMSEKPTWQRPGMVFGHNSARIGDSKSKNTKETEICRQTH